MIFPSLTRRTAMAAGFAFWSALALGAPAKAQDFPDRTVTLVVPF
ncbi:tripartite tricarboxylate transporter substrate binding protein, partial [Sinorhizobium meliloti]